MHANRFVRAMASLARGLLGFAALATAAVAIATPISGELFYTRFFDAPNVKKVAFSYDGVSSFVLGAPVVVGTTPGADGIAQNPKNPDLLIVGGQGPDISNISKSTAAVATVGSAVDAFHLEVIDSDTVYAMGIPDIGMSRHSIGPGGVLSPGTFVSLSGASITITQLITTPFGFFYTSSGAAGGGEFGTLAFGFGGYASALDATTTLLAVLPAAHGGVYDPFTGDIILFGDGHITQVDFTGAVVSDYLTPVGFTMDQGTVDGAGHLFGASNSGDLVFIDYGSTGLVGTGFAATTFLDSFLDDIAPLIGAGSTKVAEPATTALLAVAIVAMAAVGRFSRRRAVAHA